MKSVIAMVSALFLSALMMACQNGGTKSGNTTVQKHEETKVYSINTTEEWINHVANAKTIKEIDDGLLSMSRDKIVDITLELTEELGAYGYMVNEYGTVYADLDKAKNQCLAWNYIMYGANIHKDIFTSQQWANVEGIHSISQALAILASEYVLGKGTANSLMDAYGEYKGNTSK